jgi:DNA repair protein RadC
MVARVQTDKAFWQNKGAGHRGRLRDKFRERGLSGFTEVEILEMLLTFGTPRTDCKEPARKLLETFGTFAKVIEAPDDELQKIAGVGPKNSFALRFIAAAAAYYLQDRLQGRQYLHSSKEVAEYLMYSMRGLKKEVLTVIFLDSSHAILQSAIMAEGTLNINTIYPREVLKKALDVHAAALILAHNHPSGSLVPSPQDRKLTKTLYLLCTCMQIQVLDHILVGDGYYSFADHGLMADIKMECQTTMAAI